MEKPSVVLIVEDDALLAEMALEMVEEAGLPAIAGRFRRRRAPTI